MLIENAAFEPASATPDWDGEPIFRFCTFDRITTDGASFDGAMMWSTLRDCDGYWTLFNTAIFVEAKFERCAFRGASFRGCQFVACRFDDCRFVLDNLGGACVFDKSSLTECAFDRCEVTPDPRGRPVFTATRFYGCAQSATKGMDGLW